MFFFLRDNVSCLYGLCHSVRLSVSLSVCLIHYLPVLRLPGTTGLLRTPRLSGRRLVALLRQRLQMSRHLRTHHLQNKSLLIIEQVNKLWILLPFVCVIIIIFFLVLQLKAWCISLDVFLENLKIELIFLFAWLLCDKQIFHIFLYIIWECHSHDERMYLSKEKTHIPMIVSKYHIQNVCSSK